MLDLLGLKASKERRENQAATDLVASKVSKVPRVRLVLSEARVPSEVATLAHKVLKELRVQRETRALPALVLAAPLALLEARVSAASLARMAPRVTQVLLALRVVLVAMVSRAIAAILVPWAGQVFAAKLVTRDCRESRVILDTQAFLGRRVMSVFVALVEMPEALAKVARWDPRVLVVPSVAKVAAVSMATQAQLAWKVPWVPRASRDHVDCVAPLASRARRVRRASVDLVETRELSA